MSLSNLSPTKFLGFQNPTYTLIPKVVADLIMQDLSTGELRCLLYILGRTFGWKKNTDKISLSQFLHGIQTKEGIQKDFGVGLSKKTLLLSLKALEEKGIIVRKRTMTLMGDCDSTEFELKMKIEKSDQPKKPWPWKRSAFFQMPDQIFTQELGNLSGNELKILLFIARWTTHTENQTSPISIREMTHGIVKSGTCLSRGAGIGDKKNTFRILSQLEKKKMIHRKKISHISGGTMPSEYSLYQEEGMVENIPTHGMVISTSTRVVETTPTLGVEKNPTPMVENTPTGVVKTTPHTNTALTKEYLNTISKKLTQKFYKALNIKASSKKIEKEKRVIFELLEKDKFTPEQIENSFLWVARKFPDTFHIHRLPMLIGQALRGVVLSHRVIKTLHNPLEDQKHNDESSRKKIQEFEKLPPQLQKFWISKAPKIFSGETAKKGWAVGNFQQELDNFSEQSGAQI
jgi:hypothetical protein